MKTFFRKNKILLFTLIAVLCLGVLSGLMIAGVIRISTGGSSFETVAEAKRGLSAPETDSQTDFAPEAMPAAEDSKLSADGVKQIAERVQRRRRSVIPVHTDTAAPANKFRWDVDTPSKEWAETARKAAEDLTETLFGASYDELTGYLIEEASVTLLTDKEGDRDPFFLVQDPGGTCILALRGTDLGLICADLLTYPDGAAVDRNKENMMIAEKLGYTASAWDRSAGMRDENIYYYKTQTKTCLTFAYIGNKLWQVAVFPSSDAALECEYFLADLQHDTSKKAYPENFVEAEPPKLGYDKMIGSEKIVASLSRLYRDLSGEHLDDLTTTFYRDESGAREDCWQITGKGFDVTVSAYSRNVIRFNADIPCKDLRSIPYSAMGGKEYEDAAKMIAQEFITSLWAFDDSFHGKEVKEVSTNAVYDGHYCTVLIEYTDGTIYECCFKDGVLKEIWYSANSKLYCVGSRTGWVADTVYVKSATGKYFIPDYIDWDGDLHVSPRPER